MHFWGGRTLRRLLSRGSRRLRAQAMACSRFPITSGRSAGTQKNPGDHGGVPVAETPAAELNPLADAAGQWQRLQRQLSEPSGYFFSENIVSNESGYLAARPALQATPPGLAYLGVGPEQNLSYLAALDCPLGFILDIRQDNARLHLLYRAIFEEAESRSEWLALLLGRPWDGAGDPGPAATVEQVLNHATRCRPTRASFSATQHRLESRLRHLLPGLGNSEIRRIRRIHRWFGQRQLELTFQLTGPRLRRYPTLLDMLTARGPDGQQRGFLATEPDFQRIRALERGAAVLPVVGDLAGPTALRGISTELSRRGLQLGTLYISNIEQYLFEEGTWEAWVNNLRQLPCHPEALLIRSYFANAAGPVPDPPRTLLAQLQRSLSVAAKAYLSTAPLPTHQMTTVVHRLAPFLARAQENRYSGYRELVCDSTLCWHRTP